MMPASRHLLLMLLTALPLGAAAQIYVCKDASGRTITADRPVQECANRATRELDHNGLVRREIPAPLTPQQKREQEALAAQQREEAAARQEQRLYDRALLTRYRNESDIAISRQQSLDLLNEQMRIDTNALAREKKDADAARSLAKGGKAGAAERRQLEEVQRRIELRTASIASRNTEIARSNEKYDKALKRFRELSALSASSP